MFTYDNNGNIVERCEYAYTTKTGEELSEQTCTHFSYDYDGDKLISYNGEECEYNSLGNPVKYRGKALQWSYGKFLTKFDKTVFTYDGLGRRVYKDYIEFFYDSTGRLIVQAGDNLLEFIYDNEEVIGLKKDGTQYFYRKDAQGNITAILDRNGNVVVKYVYDAWGNHAVLDADGNDIEDLQHIGNLNPLRYRGYCYDRETGLYYLGTRYYDPETGRFISQDSIEYADPQSINGLNLYAYCGNNPVMYIDPDGTKPKLWEWLLSVGAIALGVGLCFVPGGQGFGVSLAVAGGSMLVSNIMSAAGVNGKTASLISSGLDIAAGIVLCFTPFAGLGASLIGAGIGGIAGGYISAAAGGSFELGAAIGGIAGSLIGGKIYDTIKISQLSRAGTVVIGEGMNRVTAKAKEIGAVTYGGMPGFTGLAKVLPEKVINQLGLAHNARWIKWVVTSKVSIVDLGVCGNNSLNYLMESLYVFKWLL